MAKNTKKTLPTSIEMGSVQFSDDCSNGFITSVEEIGDEQGNERGNGDAHKARHHKRVVEQIFPMMVVPERSKLTVAMSEG